MKTSDNTPSNKVSKESIENTIKVFDDIDILKQLANTWRYFSDFRLSCMNIEKTEELLSILSTISSVIEFENVEIFNHINVSLPEFKIIEELWNTDYNLDILKKILLCFDYSNTSIDKDYDNFIKEVQAIELDPILKFVAIFSYTFKYCQNDKNIMRIVSMFIFKKLGIVSRPILYPLEFIYSTKINYLDKESAIIILKIFEYVSRFGECTIDLIDNNIEALQSEMLAIKELKKFSTSKYFYYIFSKLYIKITDFMSDLNIKRDKAARLLAKLVKQGYLKEKKLGKEKVFINMYMIELLKNMDKKELVKEYLK